jgi:phage tail sheath protein FI
VYVDSVSAPTPNYFDNSGVAKLAFTSSIPINSSGSFSSAGGTENATINLYDKITSGNTQGLVGASYTNMINLLTNKDDYKFNILLTPGLTSADHTSQISTIISTATDRGDFIYVPDLVLYGQTLANATTAATNRNTSYAASYWPWVQTVDPDSGQNVWVPASTLIGGVYAYTDLVSAPWFAPAGVNRGGLSSVIRAERKLSQTERDTLYASNVNPIATFPGTGVVVYGQKTLQKKPSALDRVNVRRLLIELKSFISQVALGLVFEQNTSSTRSSFLSQVNPYLESVQQRQGLYSYNIVMDESNNTPDVVDRNMLVGAIYLQPTKTAEFIYLDFNITPTGATFPA